MEDLNKQKFEGLSREELVKRLYNLSEENKNLKNQNNSLSNDLNNANKKIESLKNEVEILIKQILNEKINIVNKVIYKDYDSKQKDIKKEDIEMTIPINQQQSEKMFNQFKEYITKIDIKSHKIIKNPNNKIQNKFLERTEINKIINHEFEKNLEMNEFLDAFVKAIENNINKNWELKDRITFKNNLEKLCNNEIKKIFYK